jgi:hypothetical protein
MAEEKKYNRNWVVCQVGTENGPEHGCLDGFDDLTAANENAADRNTRAIAMGLKARYRVIAGVPAG